MIELNLNSCEDVTKMVRYDLSVEQRYLKRQQQSVPDLISWHFVIAWLPTTYILGRVLSLLASPLCTRILTWSPGPLSTYTNSNLSSMCLELLRASRVTRCAQVISGVSVMMRRARVWNAVRGEEKDSLQQIFSQASSWLAMRLILLQPLRQLVLKTNGQLEDTGQSRNWGKVILDCEKQSISTLDPEGCLHCLLRSFVQCFAHTSSL
eukprot:Em0009g435a